MEGKEKQTEIFVEAAYTVYLPPSSTFSLSAEQWRFNISFPSAATSNRPFLQHLADRKR